MTAMNLTKWFAETPKGIDGKSLPIQRIHTLEDIILDRFGKDVTITSVNRLRSKKNSVFHLKLLDQSSEEIDVVAKMFIEGKYENELTILSTSYTHGLSVPQILDARENVILMIFIPGEVIVDRINRTFEPKIIEQLAEWYFKFHSLYRQVKADPRLRNFIYHDEQIFGVDFEESHPGHWMIDIGGVCASLLDTNPIFDSRKRVLSWHLLDTYLSYLGEERTPSIEALFITTIADTLKQTSIWRDDATILELSERIRQEGLPED